MSKSHTWPATRLAVLVALGGVLLAGPAGVARADLAPLPPVIDLAPGVMGTEGAVATPAPTPAPTPVPPPPEVGLAVAPPPRSDGLELVVSWTAPTPARGLSYALLRGPTAVGPFTLVADGLPPETTEHTDALTADARTSPPPEEAFYRLAFITPDIAPLRETFDKAQLFATAKGSEATEADLAAVETSRQAYITALTGRATPPVRGVPNDTWFDPRRLALAILIVVMGGLILFFTRQARLGKEIFIRRIPGVDAIEEAVGRATEMGRPVLYIPGIGEFQEIQTIASLLILGRVAEVIANYDSDVIVACTYPIVREVADESVKQGYFQAGRPDAYKPQNVRFLSSEQFAFTASTNGIILREKPAANIYLGQFFAESLILAETGFVNRSIQIAGTAETTQIPFFVTACDYTLIGEELYAVSAYLTREPRLTSSLKASDWVRLVLIGLLVAGTVLTMFGYTGIQDALLMR